MHIKPSEAGPTGSAKPNESASTRKLRLGAATRVPVHAHSKTTDSPLRVLVSAIGHSLGARTPLRNQRTGISSSASKSGPSSFSVSKTPASSSTGNGDKQSSTSTSSSSGGRMNTDHTSAAKLTSSLGTPSRLEAASRMPRRSSLSTPSYLLSATKSTKKPSISSTPLASKKSSTATTSSASRKLDGTPITKKSTTFPARTPNAGNNPATPTSSSLFIPLPSRTQSLSSAAPANRGKSLAPGQTRLKSIFPTTPVSNPPATTVDSDATYNTPHTTRSSHSFYTPRSTRGFTTALQPRNHNSIEPSRRLHFGINVAAMAEQQDNMGSKTPKSYTPGSTDTFTFDKDRLAVIKAGRRNAAPLLKSPAQRVRVTDLQPPPQAAGKVLEQLAEDRSPRFENEVANSLVRTPVKRRVANSLF